MLYITVFYICKYYVSKVSIARLTERIKTDNSTLQWLRILKTLGLIQSSK